MNKDLMIDIETLGVSQNSVICSLGAVLFYYDVDSYYIENSFYTTLDPEEGIMDGFVVDWSTIKFWMNQSKKVRYETFPDKPTPVPLAIDSFIKWVEKLDFQRVWAKSPEFDLSLLKVYFDHYAPSAWPFHYRNHRDVRTLLDIANVKEKDIPPVGETHNSLNDAAFQSLCVFKAYQKIKSNG